MASENGSLPADLLELFARAEKAAENSYSPYSGFRVGAALRCKDGSIFTGCNIESASYGLTICAERVAVSNAISSGVRQFDAIAIFVDANDGQPCGACRQFLAEFALSESSDLTVVYVSSGKVTMRPLSNLLPESFCSSALS